MKVGMALFFIILSLSMLLDEQSTGYRKRKSLLLVFLFGSIVSYYATPYLFAGVLIFSWIVMKVVELAKFTTKRNKITPMIAVLFFAIYFLWYGQIIGQPFQDIVLFAKAIADKLTYLFTGELISPSTLGLLGYGRTSQVADMINLVTSSLVKLFIGLGLIHLWLSHRKKHVGTRFPLEYTVMTTIFSFAFLSLSFLPLSSDVYGADRLTLLTMILVSPAYFLGGKLVIGTLKKGRGKEIFLLSIILLAFFLSQSGVFQGVFGEPISIPLSIDIERHGMFVHEQEVFSIRWLTSSSTELYWRNSDFFSALKLWSYGVSLKQIVMTPDSRPIEGYAYLGRSNIVERKFWSQYQEGKMRSYEITPLYDYLLQSNKILDNGASQIFKIQSQHRG